MNNPTDAPGPRYIESARAIDARLRPAVERICGRLGLRLDDVLADGFTLPPAAPPPPPAPAAPVVGERPRMEAAK